MEYYYLEIRTAHIAAVIASGSLLLLRALAVNVARAQWPLHPAIRILSYTIDSILLTAALMLMTIIGQYPLTVSWLTVKLLCVIIYILLGYLALRGRNAMLRRVSLLAAVLVYGFIISVAIRHDPYGILASA